MFAIDVASKREHSLDDWLNAKSLRSTSFAKAELSGDADSENDHGSSVRR